MAKAASAKKAATKRGATAKKAKAAKPKAAKSKAASKPKKANNGSTASQNEAFDKVMLQQLGLEKTGKANTLKVSFRRGQVASRVLSAEKRADFGKRDIDEIAARLGVKRLTVQQSMRFASLIGKDELEALCELAAPPSWRMMAQWVGIKDETKRGMVLQDIMSGRLTAEGFDEKLRAALSRGPKKPRRPAGGAATFVKIGAEAMTLRKHLEWVDKAQTEINRLKDTAARQEAVTVIRTTASQIRDTIDELKAALEICDALSK